MLRYAVFTSQRDLLPCIAQRLVYLKLMLRWCEGQIWHGLGMSNGFCVQQ